MSSYTSSNRAIGIVLQDGTPEFAHVLEHAKVQKKLEGYDEDVDVGEFLRDFGGEYLTKYATESAYFTNLDGDAEELSTKIGMPDVIVLPSRLRLDTLNDCFQYHYTKEDFVKDLKKGYSAWLPEKFDYEEHSGELLYTFYG